MQKITQRFVQKLEAPQKGNKLFWDGAVGGFGVRITEGNVVSFVLRYQCRGNEKRRVYTIGRWPQWSADAAREKATELRKKIREGVDPLAVTEIGAGPGENTMADLARDYLATAEKHKRPSSIRNDKSMVNNIIIPALGDKAVIAVTELDIEALHNSLRATPYRANRVLSLLSTMFNRAIFKIKLRSDNPCKGVKRCHEDKRERWLSPEEIHALLKACDAYEARGTSSATDVIRLLILTGSRLREVMHAKWENIDLKRGIWIKPSHSTKEKKTEHVPISAESIEVLRKLEKKRAGSPFVFAGAEKNSARTSIHRCWLSVCRAGGLAEEYTMQGKRRQLKRYRPTVRIHDLRHSFASNAINRGKSLQIVGKLLGHCRPETTQRYAHVSDAAMREVVDDLGSILITKPEPEPKPQQQPQSRRKRERNVASRGSAPTAAGTERIRSATP